MSTQENFSMINQPENRNRRKAIKKIAAGVGVLAASAVLPEQWTRPIVGQIILPAHAETSGAAGEAAPTTPSDEYNTSEVYTLRSIEGNDKRFAWLNQTGSYYGGPIKFVFSDNCGELHVPDASVSHGADGNTSNYNQAFYFCGTDFPASAKENNNNLASVFTPPGCPAATVTIFYNK